MRCFGYDVVRRAGAVPATRPGMAPGPRAPMVRFRLRATGRPEVVDSSRLEDVGVATCRVPPLRGVDTLLATSLGEPVALRLRREDLDRAVWLVADADLFRNRALRETDAGPLVLDLYRYVFAGDPCGPEQFLEWRRRAALERYAAPN